MVVPEDQLLLLCLHLVLLLKTTLARLYMAVAEAVDKVEPVVLADKAELEVLEVLEELVLINTT